MKNYSFLVSNPSKSHHIELLKEMENFNLNYKFITSYPKFLIDKNLSKKKIISKSKYFWFYHFFRKMKFDSLMKYSYYKMFVSVENEIKKNINLHDIFLSLSGTVGNTSKEILKYKKFLICERPCSHIEFQNEIMMEEFELCDLKYLPTDKKLIDREKREYENAKFILTPSQFAKDTFSKKDISNVEVINYPTNLSTFTKVSNVIKNKNLNLTYVGQLSLRKGIHYILDAFLKLDLKNVNLNIVGYWMGNHEEKNFLLEKMNKLNDKNFKFYGKIANHNLKNILSDTDIFISPSIEDGYAITVNEAAACGAATIVSENTGSKDFVRKNNCGYVVPIRNVDAICEKILFLNQNKDLLELLKSNALKANSKFTWSNYLIDLVNKIKKYS